MNEEAQEKLFLSYAKHAEDNEIELLNSNQCGCYFCRHIFSARSVNEWDNTEGHVSAICPECGMPTVIGDASGVPLSKQLLKDMNLYFFDSKDANLGAAMTYCARYLARKITHNEKNEHRYVDYLTELYMQNHDVFAFHLAYYYETGGEFGVKDLPRAMSIYTSPILVNDGNAKGNMARILFNMDDPERREEAYLYASESLALGNPMGAYWLARCYYEGIGTKHSVDLCFAIAEHHFQELFHDLNGDIPLCIYAFYHFAMLLGELNEEEFGSERDEEDAVRYYMFAKLAYQCLLDVDSIFLPDIKELDERIERLANKLGLKPNIMSYDSNTFYDSFAMTQDEESVKTLRVIRYDEAEGILELEISYSQPVALIDFSFLDCKIAEGKIVWNFNHVASFKGSDGVFFRVGSPDGESWSFYNGEDEIASIRFQNNEEK